MLEKKQARYHAASVIRVSNNAIDSLIKGKKMEEIQLTTSQENSYNVIESIWLWSLLEPDKLDEKIVKVRHPKKPLQIKISHIHFI